MPDVYDMTGRNASWLRSRIGHLCGSEMHRVVTYGRGGFRRASAEKRATYIMELVAERMTDSAMGTYVTAPMQRGIDCEPEAIEAYEHKMRVKVMPAEFILHPTIEYFGGTPDGLVGADGGVDTKCPTTKVYAEWRLANKVPPEHMPQIAAYLCITRRKWWDLAAYDDRVKHGPKLTVWRYEPPAEDLAIVAEEARLFLAQVDLCFRQVTEQS